MPKTHKHDDLVLEVAENLNRRGYAVQTFCPYKRNGYEGELDVYAISGDVHEYHEIKCSSNQRAIRRAEVQFERARKAFPKRNWKFYIHTPKEFKEVFV